jgi:hypothetical protein
MVSDISLDIREESIYGLLGAWALYRNMIQQSMAPITVIERPHASSLL